MPTIPETIPVLRQAANWPQIENAYLALLNGKSVEDDTVAWQAVAEAFPTAQRRLPLMQKFGARPSLLALAVAHDLMPYRSWMHALPQDAVGSFDAAFEPKYLHPNGASISQFTAEILQAFITAGHAAWPTKHQWHRFLRNVYAPAMRTMLPDLTEEQGRRLLAFYPLTNPEQHMPEDHYAPFREFMAEPIPGLGSAKSELGDAGWRETIAWARDALHANFLATMKAEAGTSQADDRAFPFYVSWLLGKDHEMGLRGRSEPWKLRERLRFILEHGKTSGFMLEAEEATGLLLHLPALADDPALQRACLRLLFTDHKVFAMGGILHYRDQVQAAQALFPLAATDPELEEAMRERIERAVAALTKSEAYTNDYQKEEEAKTARLRELVK